MGAINSVSPVNAMPPIQVPTFMYTIHKGHVLWGLYCEREIKWVEIGFFKKL